MARIEMLAAVCDTPGEGDVLNLRRVLVDDPHELEVRVKIETTGGTDVVCRPIDLDLKVAGTIGLSPCIVKSITKLTPPQIASLPPKLKP